MVVGNLTIDEIQTDDSNPITAMGGTAMYASLAARERGIGVGIVSKVGFDFPDEYVRRLRGVGINVDRLKRVPKTVTTRFSLRYRGETRALRLLGRCEDMGVSDVQEMRSRALHIGAVAGEVPTEMVRFLADRCEILSIDLQGFTRSFDNRGLVRLKEGIDMGALDPAAIVKCSREELLAATGEERIVRAARIVKNRGPDTLLVTMGPRGSLLFHGDRCHEIPAYEPEKIVDVTGAGDVFVGSFIAEFLKGRDLLWCASIASSSSSLTLERRGVWLGSKSELERRASLISQRIKEISSKAQM